MPAINGGVCVINGKPVDKVYSNGVQVYGRNLLSMTKNFNPTKAGDATSNQNVGLIFFAGNKEISDLFKVGDYITTSFKVEFLNTELYNDSSNQYVALQIWKGNWQTLASVAVKNMNGKFYTMDCSENSGYIENPTHKVTVSATTQLTQGFITTNATVNMVEYIYNTIPAGANTNITDLKIEKGSVATPWTPAPEDVGV